MAEEEDDIMDFFDLNKKFEKKCVLKGSSINTNYKFDPKSMAPELNGYGEEDGNQEEMFSAPGAASSGNSASSASGFTCFRGARPRVPSTSSRRSTNQKDYSVYYKEKEQREMMLRYQRERAGDDGPLSKGSIRGSAMSQLDDTTTTYRGRTTTVAGSRVGDSASHLDLTTKYNFNKVASKGGELPIFKHRDDIMDQINGSQVTIISGFTGCGKTTQIPQFIMDDCVSKRERFNIVVTQPRRIAAKTVATRVCKERNWPLGRLVGYKIGLDKENTSPDTRLMFCTTGVLKKMVISKKHLHDWTHVILDEVHEREEDMDFLLLLCKKLLHSNSRGVKLILMSATISVEKLSEYFTVYHSQIDKPILPCRMEIPEVRKFAITPFYADEFSNLLPEAKDMPDFFGAGPKLYDECVYMCKKLIINTDKLDPEMMKHKKKSDEDEKKKEKGIVIDESKEEEKKPEEPNRRGTVLVFLPGEAEIIRVKRFLQTDRSDVNHRWEILVLHSRMPFDDMGLVFTQPHPSVKRIILATNVAESSITIPDVCYVIDFCLTKNLLADPDTNYVSLRLQFADQNSLQQRAGRSGRVREGRVYRLITKDFMFNGGVPEEHPPEMVRAPLEKVILDTKLLEFGAPKELLALALDPPDISNIYRTTLHLKQIGALLTTVNGVHCKEDGDLTPLGEIMAGLPCDVRLGKLIVFGHIFNVLEEAVIVAAGLTNKSVFATPMEKKLEAYASKLVWADRSFSDCIAIVNAYRMWKRHHHDGYFNKPLDSYKNLENEWCYHRFLQQKSLRDLETTIQELELALKRNHIVTQATPNRPDLKEEEKMTLLQYAIFGAFYPNYFTRSSSSVDLKEVHKTMYGFNPMNAVYLSGFPQRHKEYGQLYVNDIKEMFKVCGNPDRMEVGFDAGKIIVQFTPSAFDHAISDVTRESYDFKLNNINESENLTGEIIHQVFVALKIREQKFMQRQDLNVYVFPEDIAKSKMDEVIKRKKTKDDEKKVTGPHEVVLFKDVGLIKPPPLDMDILAMEVVHVNNPSSFFVQYDDRDTANDMALVDQATEKLLETVKVDLITSTSQVVKNGIFLAPFTDVSDDSESYYRCRVDGVDLVHSNRNKAMESRGGRIVCQADNYEARVTFLDFGNVEVIPLSRLVPITGQLARKFPALVKVPALAMECTLSHTKPNPLRNPKGLWDEDVIDAFKAVVEVGAKLKAKIHSVVCHSERPLISLEVFPQDQNPDDKDSMSINETLKMPLKDNGKSIPSLAARANESYLSDQNHDCRTGYQLYSPEWRHAAEDIQQFGTSLANSKFSEGVDLPRDRDQRYDFVRLKGPHSPLEFKINAATRVGSTMQVRVEPESVNSILLDRYPTDVHTQWMVASHVGMTPNGGSLVARATTFMPNQHGLGALLLMIFAPFVELRAHRKLKRYTGFLAGLGDREKDWGRSDRTGGGRASAEKTYVSYHPEHDIEVALDVKIDNEDITSINEIRYYINNLMTRKHTDARSSIEARRRDLMGLQLPDEVVKVQPKILSLLKGVLSRQREDKTPEYFQHEYRWREGPRDDNFLLPIPIHGSENFVFKMITGYKLVGDKGRNSVAEMSKILKKLERMDDIANKNLRNVNLVCPICHTNKVLETSEDVLRHINSKRHYVMFSEL